MEQRHYDLAEMLRDAEGKNAYVRRNQPIPPCINTEYCLPTPENKNGGILTMAFVDMQPLESVYPTEIAFCNGSLFPNIDKPFLGGNCR